MPYAIRDRVILKSLLAGKNKQTKLKCFISSKKGLSLLRKYNMFCMYCRIYMVPTLSMLIFVTVSVKNYKYASIAENALVLDIPEPFYTIIGA